MAKRTHRIRPAGSESGYSARMPARMPSKSKNKGNGFEREVAKILGEWWGEPFQRTPNSGALRWNGNFWTFGDLLPPESFPCVIECKFYKKSNLNILLTGTPQPGNMLGWWAQCIEDVDRAEKELGKKLIPILITKANFQPRLICLPRTVFRKLYKGSKIPYITAAPLHLSEFAILKLDYFLEYVDKQKFQRYTQCLQKTKKSPKSGN